MVMPWSYRHMVCRRYFSLSAWACPWNLEVEVEADGGVEKVYASMRVLRNWE